MKLLQRYDSKYLRLALHNIHLISHLVPFRAVLMPEFYI